ncbi:BTAD domain-containing putative transcriptional regulator [Actinacidiphila sp. DG2A-62]|uniref:AfsR/SARP family transcriptional regulator n=1 Tax=Actinacidiphila sp. DG2A-62 TaxID=3108821 RepID=UPI002DBEA0E1|nr:BTAD domain-containing putative transcriptional regulator [Actinacidiphila sp. DG2A-62]MEC3992748.1 BTAD domain-containing putative transcriptional regulator [Actinacidiphila sp. DG2A-62]
MPPPAHSPAPAASTGSHWDLHLLGSFALTHGTRGVDVPPLPQKLFAFLAVHTRPVPRMELAHALWPDHEESRASANLRCALWRLPGGRRPGHALVDEHRTGLQIAPHVAIDARLLQQQAAVLGRAAEAGATAALPSTGTLCQDLLPDWHDDWLLAAREWHRQLRLRALEQLAAHQCRAGRLEEALEAAMAAVACEPLRESAHRAVAAVHLAEGNPSEALRHYDRYRERLRDELGIAPSPRFRDLLAPLLARPLDR